jgi:hypothetical protein
MAEPAGEGSVLWTPSAGVSAECTAWFYRNVRPDVWVATGPLDAVHDHGILSAACADRIP